MVRDIGQGQPDLTDVEISTLGKLIYRQNNRPLIADKDIGRFVDVDVISSEYEIDENMLDATHQLRKRVPEACGYMIRVGIPLPYSWAGMKSQSYDLW